MASPKLVSGKPEEVRTGISVKVVARQSSQLSATVAASTPKVSSADELRPQQLQVAPLGSGPLPACSPPPSSNREEHGTTGRSEDPDAGAFRTLQRAADVGDVSALVAVLPQAVAAGVSVQLLNEAYERCAGLEAEMQTARLRRTAVQALRESLREGGSNPPQALASAIAQVRDLGALQRGDELLENAQEELDKRQAQSDAEDGLLAALRACSAVELAPLSAEAPTAVVEALARAVERAHTLGVSAPELLAHSKRRLDTCRAWEERRQICASTGQEMQDLLAAGGDALAFEALLERATKVGIGNKTIDAVREQKAAEQLQHWQDKKARLASERLKAMMEREEESAEALRTTASYAAELGASEDQLQTAHRRVSKLEKERERHRQSSSMSGASPCKPKTSPAARIFATADVPTYGLDAELQAKAAAKYDANAEEEAAHWIQAITGTEVVGDFFGALCTGEVLCHLMNAIRPGTVPKVNEAGMPFKERENISNFLRACRSLGVQEYALFSTDDLYEKKDLNSVVRCVHALGGALPRSVPEFAGPHLGVADTSKAKRDQKREFGQVTQTGGLCMAMERPHIDMTSNQIVRGGG